MSLIEESVFCLQIKPNSKMVTLCFSVSPVSMFDSLYTNTHNYLCVEP